MDAQDVLFGAAQFTADAVGEERLVRTIENNLKLSGQEILRHVRPNDRGGIFTPALFQMDGKEPHGCVLTLQDRAILAWTTGTFRIRNFSEVVPYASVKVVELRQSPAEETRIELTADQRWSLRFVFDGLEGGLNIPALLVGVLDGSVQFEHES
jgi:hypothetical protein